MNFLKRLFKKNYNIGIIRFGDNIVIPGRDYFKNEKDIELLEEYKKHYIEELCKRKAVTTLNFNSNKLKQDMKMNIDLILKVLLDNEDFYLLAPEELIIQSLKLKMYYEEINALEEETILRLIALKEIEKSKKVSRHNRMALEEEINQLSIILEMYSYRKTAINIELKNYFDIISTKDLEKQDTEIYKQRLEKLLFITDGIIDKKEIDKYEDIKVKMAILERICERYAYQNKNKITDILFRLDKLFNKVQSDIVRNCEMNYYLNEVLELEKILTLYFDYGFNLINKDVMKKLYNIKFDVLTDNIENNESPIKKDDYGYTYYKEIISENIEDLIMGRNKELHELFSNTFNSILYERLLINNIKEILNIFNYDEILSSVIKLRLCTIARNNIYRFYYQTSLKELKEIYEFEEPGIVWDESIKLEDVFKYVTHDNPIYSNPLYRIYKSIYSANSIDNVHYLDYMNDIYTLPEGIIEINFNEMSKSNYDYFKEKCNRVDLHFPSSLKKIIYGNFFNDANIQTLHINEELEIFKPSNKENILNIVNNKKGEYRIKTGTVNIQLPIDTDYMRHNKTIKEVILPSSTKLFNNPDNIYNLYDYYLVEPFKDGTCLRYFPYLYCIPRFKSISFENDDIKYYSKLFESHCSGWTLYNQGIQYFMTRTYHRTMVIIDRIYEKRFNKHIKVK